MESRNWTIVVGSHRPKSQSGRVGSYIASRVAKLFPKIETRIGDLGKAPLPFWDESMWGKSASPTQAAWAPIKATLERSEAVIVISPEWGGMAPAALKNFFLFASGSAMAHKPGYLVSVSAGPGGAYPIAELRASSYKNSHLVYIPEQLIVRSVETVFAVDEKEATGNDQYLRNRLDYGLTVLEAYAQALTEVRRRGVVRLQDYPNGM
jgi:NAD(P)H-dependent FMN reductase